MDVRGFEFDDRNRAHLARREIDDNLILELFLGEPRFAENPPAPGRSGSHLMIGRSTIGRFWTIVIVQVDDEGTWRPITGWPSTGKEIRWHESN